MQDSETFKRTTFFAAENRLAIRSAAETSIKMQQWAIPDYLAKGSLTALAGPKASGKSTLYATMAAAITRGETQPSWPGKLLDYPGNVLIFSSEDDWDKTIVPRLKAADANLNNVSHIDGKTRNGYLDSIYNFDIKDDDYLRQTVKDLGGVSLIVIDPWTNVITGDANNGVKVQRTLERISLLAKQMDTAILLIAHVVKADKGRDPIARFAGNAAVTRVPRGLLIVSKIDNDSKANEATHVLVRVGTNIGITGGGWSYHIDSANVESDDGIVSVSKIVWDNELIGTPEDILSEAENTGRSKKSSATEKASDFLKNTLKNGPCPFPELLSKASEMGISNSSLQRVRKDLGIKYRKNEGAGQPGYFIWWLPEYEEKSQFEDAKLTE